MLSVETEASAIVEETTAVDVQAEETALETTTEPLQDTVVVLTMPALHMFCRSETPLLSSAESQELEMQQA
jgi:hypothetical protein